MNISAEAIVAAYAAIVATAAFALEIRRWFDAKPRLKLSLIADGMIIGGGDEFDEKDLVIVNVTNRGRIEILITNLTIHEMATWWDRLCKRDTKNYVVTNPQLKGYPRNIPGEVKPAHTWTGIVRDRPDVIPNLRNGIHYVGISTSHFDKPYFLRIPKKVEKK